MDDTLTDRYIDAVTRAVPERQRGDVADELRTAIADQADARVAAGDSAADAEREVLTALGDPEALAADYADRPLRLIGPQLYLTWKRLLVLLLWIVTPFAFVGVALGQTLAGAGIGEIIGSTVGATLGVVVHLCFWVTLVFAVLERTGSADPGTPWSLDRLPERRGGGAGVSDLVATIIFSVLLAGALVWDAVVGAVHLEGRWHSFLAPAMWPVWTGALLAVIGLEVVLALVVFLTRRWTRALAVANTVLAAAAAGILLTALGRGLLLNPELIRIARDSGASADLARVLAIITAFCVVGVAVWDSVDGFLKARRDR